MSQYDLTHDLKINVGHCDLYFMVHWFCLISWRLFDVWTSYFGIMSQYDLTFWPQNTCTSLWLIFHDPVILPYILKTLWCMNIWDYESVWPNVWPQNKCRSLWPIFHGPVILPYILKTLWCMSIILWDYESVWPDVWPQNKCMSLWPVFHGPVILPYVLKTLWCMNIILWDFESVWCDIWPKNKCMSLWPIFHGPVILPFILKTVWYLNTILWDYESVWPGVWPRNKCRSLWPIFHWPVILPYIFVFDRWMSYFWKISQCNTDQWFLFIFCSEKHFSFIGKARFRWATLSCDSSYSSYDVVVIKWHNIMS